MKKLVFGLIATVMLFSSCFSQTVVQMKELDVIKDAKLISEIKNSGERGIPYPYGSTVTQNSDKTFSINLPKNYSYVMQNNNGDVFTMRVSGNVTCTCSGGGCSPVLQGGTEYCVMAACSICVKSCSRINSSGTKEFLTILGIYNEEEAAIKFVVDSYSSNPLTKLLETKDVNFNNVLPSLFKFAEFEKSLFDVYNVIYDNKIPSFIVNNKDIPDTKLYKYVYVSLYGNLAVMPVPNTSDFANLKTAISVSCHCGSGLGCIKDSMFGVKYCDAGSCSKCTLSH